MDVSSLKKQLDDHEDRLKLMEDSQSFLLKIQSESSEQFQRLEKRFDGVEGKIDDFLAVLKTLSLGKKIWLGVIGVLVALVSGAMAVNKIYSWIWLK